jgi:hypothetical protein
MQRASYAALVDVGHCRHLANPAAIQKYKGPKHSDDNHDAFRLAHTLRLNILPEGYIYPDTPQGCAC